MSKIRVLIVDDSRTMQLIVGGVLTADPDFVIAGTASSAEEAETLFGTTRIDVVSLDVEMPGIGGLDYLLKLAARSVPVVMVSTRVDRGDPVRAEALRRGATGCYPKEGLVKNAARFRALIRAAAQREVRYDRSDARLIAARAAV